MKLLFAANRFPYPPYRGDKLKIYHLARVLSRRHKLHLITFLEDENDLEHLPALEVFFERIVLVKHPKAKAYWNTAQTLLSNTPLQVGYFHSDDMKHQIAALLEEEKYDGVHIQHLRLLPYWKDITSLPRILDLPDAYSLYWKRRVEHSSGIKKWFNQLEYKRVLAYESFLAAFDKTLVCSQEDATYLRSVKQLDNVSLLPNGVDTTRFYPSSTDTARSYNILFTGNMDYAPNVDAVQYFVADIFPLIKKEIPQATFTIAGQRPVKEVLALASDDVIITGFVPDLLQVYHEAALVVAPLRYGAGTQNKVLEAMACAVPVVTRNIGYEGLGVASGQGVVLAMTASEFASACVQLLEDRSYAQHMGRQGYLYIKEHLDWDMIAHRLEQYFEAIK